MNEEFNEYDDIIHELDEEDDNKNILSQNRRKLVSQMILNFSQKENNKKFDELISDLEIFKKFYNKNYEKIKFESQYNDSSLYNTKLLLYSILEKNMIEVSCVTNKEIRTEKINTLYNWYKDRTKVNEVLRNINEKTYKDINEIDEEEPENQNQEDKVEPIKNDRETDPHRNEKCFDKKLVNNYRRKILSKRLEEKYNKIQIKANDDIDKELNIKDENYLAKTLLSLKDHEFSGGGNYSTFYSYKFGTNTTSFGKFHQTENDIIPFRETAKAGKHENNFFPNFNKTTKTYYPPIVSETKFSYSYNRPEYNFKNMVYENKILKSKTKLLAEKRTHEEIQSQIEMMGKMRAKYKEDVNYKYEVRDVVDMYSKLNDFVSPILQKYKLKPSKSMNDLKENKKITAKNIFKERPSIKNKDTNTGIRQIIRNKNANIETEDKINSKKSARKTSNEFEQMLSISPIKEDNKNIMTKIKPNKVQNERKIFSGILDKIKVDSIKNIENKKLIEPLKLTKLKIKMKINKENIQNRMLNKVKKITSRPHPEIITNLMTTDTLFQAHKNYETLCSIKKRTPSVEINHKLDNNNINASLEEDEEDNYNNFCLSLYGGGNLKKLNKNRNQNKILPPSINTVTKIKYNQMHKTYDLNKDNYLNLRKTLSDWKKAECLTLLNELTKNKTTKIEEEKNKKSNLRRQYSVLNAIINPRDKFEFSQFFLPRTGSMLLTKKAEDNKKPKKK